MKKTVSYHIYFHSTQKHLGPGLTNLRDCPAPVGQFKTVNGSPGPTHHVAMCPTRGSYSCGLQSQEQAGGKPRAVSLAISLVPLMPMTAKCPFPSGFLSRALGKARWGGSGTVIQTNISEPKGTGCREQKSATTGGT